MTSNLELKMLARLRAHEVLIQQLLWLAFNKNTDALRDFAARQNVSLDTARLPDLDTATSARLPYEAQEALASVLDEALRRAASGQLPDLPGRPRK